MDVAHQIPVSAATTRPTGRDPAAWCVPTAAPWAGLTGVVCVLQYQPSPCALRCVRDAGTDCAMMPRPDFLVRLAPQVDAIGDLPDIAQHEGTCLAFHRHIDDCTADLVCR